MTVATATVINGGRELAHRVSSGLEVTLYWNAADKPRASRSGTSHPRRRCVSPYRTDQALDAFYHPLAQVGYSIAP